MGVSSYITYIDTLKILDILMYAAGKFLLMLKDCLRRLHTVRTMNTWKPCLFKNLQYIRVSS